MTLDEKQCEALGLYLAQQRDPLSQILKGGRLGDQQASPSPRKSKEADEETQP